MQDNIWLAFIVPLTAPLWIVPLILLLEIMILPFLVLLPFAAAHLIWDLILGRAASPGISALEDIWKELTDR